MPASLAGLAHLLSAAVAASTPSAPIDWSRDGRWIAYTLVESADAPALPRGWMFTTSTPTPIAADEDRARKVHRIWATRAKGRESVAIEESPHPLSSPTWGGDGRSLVYGRFVPMEEARPIQRGRYELVIRSGLEQARVIVVQPNLELDAEARATIASQRPATSRDGRRIAMPRPGSAGGVWVVDVDEDRPPRTIEDALAPAWSPDGRRLAYLKSAPGPAGDPVVSVHLMNPAGNLDRTVSMEPSLTTSLLAWEPDGKSLLMISNPQRGPFRNSQLDLVRVSVDGGLGVRVSTLESIAQPGAPRRGGPASLASPGKAPSLRIELTMDAEHDQGVGLLDLDGREQVLKWGDLQTQNIRNRFHPLDPGLRLGSPSLAPDGQILAFRVDDGTAGLVALVELATEEVSLVTPDDWTRRRWLDRLAACGSELLLTWLPLPAADGGSVRATILPVLGELGGFHPRQFRLKRLAKFAAGPLADLTEGAEGLGEFRVFFAYLGQDFAASERALDDVSARADGPDERLRWLYLRAQILMSQGAIERARGLLDYLDRESRSPAYLVEETPGSGYTLAPIANPAHAWARHLEEKLADGTLQRGSNAMADFQGTDAQTPDMAGWEGDRIFAPNPGVMPPVPGGLNGGLQPRVRIRNFDFIQPPAPDPGLQPPIILPRSMPPPVPPGRLAPVPAGAPVLRLEPLEP